jgi:hypothetical protein
MPIHRSILALAVLLAGCASPHDDSDTDTAVGPEPVCEEPREVDCVDSLFLDLSLNVGSVSEGTVDTVADGADFVSRVDATAGGLQNAPENPWIYMRFTPEGLEKVPLDDEEALSSMAWHIAAKRYILRLNGGSSGPSCVAATALLSSTYDALDAVPDGARFLEDDYYTADCTLINDSSGLPGSPQVVLAPWWSYPGCVATTGTPFLVALDDGRVVKFMVESYYEQGQERCNEEGVMGSGSARFIWRWRFLDD